MKKRNTIKADEPAESPPRSEEDLEQESPDPSTNPSEADRTSQETSEALKSLQERVGMLELEQSMQNVISQDHMIRIARCESWVGLDRRSEDRHHDHIHVEDHDLPF